MSTTHRLKSGLVKTLFFIEFTAENEELGHIIIKAVHQLPPGQRRSFSLRYFHELSIKKIASRINKPEITIKFYLYSARQKPQNILLPYLQNEPRECYREI